MPRPGAIRQLGILLQPHNPTGKGPAQADTLQNDQPADGPDGAHAHRTARPAETPPSQGFLATLILLALVMNTLARGVTETFAVFLLPVQEALGASRADMTAAYSIFMLVLGISNPFAGQLIDRSGARVTYTFGLLALGLGYLAAGYVSNIWFYYLCVGVLPGLGSAAIGMVAASSLLSRWFTARIGSIMAVPYAASGLGMLLLPLLTQYLLETYDWRSVYKLLGLGVLSLIPLIVFLPLGRISRGSVAWRRMRQSGGQTSSFWTLRNASRTSAFWGLFALYAFTSIAAYSVLPQSVAFLVEMGFGPLVAAGAFGFTGILSAVGILGIGWLSDRLGRLRAVTFSYICSIAGTLSLLCVAIWPSPILVYGYVVLFGLMQGARGPVILSYVTLLFPGGSVGSIYGALSLGMGLGAALGSWVSGLLYEITGTYYASFLFAASASFCGLATFWVQRELRLECSVNEARLASAS